VEAATLCWTARGVRKASMFALPISLGWRVSWKNIYRVIQVTDACSVSLTMVSAFLAWLTGLARALPAPRRQEWAFVQPTLRPSWHVGTEEWRSRVWRVATRGARCVCRP
jgi:hypothetical protein